MARKDVPVLILGGGTWGLSTALHLLNSGYIDITVIERAEQIPSRYSAGWDLNKTVRAEYEDTFYTGLALDAMEGRKTPLFGPYYHQTGYVVATTGRAPQKVIDHLQKALSSVASHPTFATGIKPLDGSKDFKDYTWQYTGPLTGFKGYFNRIAGYAHSADALKGIWEHCVSRGVKFIMGESAGKAVELLYTDANAFTSSSTGTRPQKGAGNSQCIGVKTADGKRHLADLTICALGAYNASLVPKSGEFRSGAMLVGSARTAD